jgi:hypothetical protein
VRWKTNPLEGWKVGFALVPVQLDDGTTVWLETFHYYCNHFGVVTARIK